MKILSDTTGLLQPTLSRRFVLIVGVALAALTLILHGSALQGFWRFDDPAILLYILENPDIDGYFLSAKQWRAGGVPFFTPWLILDYWLDLRLFGLQPAMFIAHHLLVIWLAALLTFVLLYRYAGAFWSNVAAMLFLLGSPVAIVSQQVMTRHYVTGLVFAILSILFWLRARESPMPFAPALSAVFYLLAMLNKEIFAPLPLVLYFLQDGTLKSRFVAMFPLASSAAIFLLWRSAMLGKVIGGYAGLDAAKDLPASFVILPQIFFGTGLSALAAGALLLPVAGWALYVSRRHALLILAASVALLLPFLAIKASLHPVYLRFAFLPWWGGCVLLSLGFSRIWYSPRSRLAAFANKVHLLIVFVLLIVVAIALGKRQESATEMTAIVDSFDVQGRFMWSHGETESYVPYGDLSVFGYGLAGLRKHHLGNGSPVAIPIAEAALRLGAPMQVYVYDPHCRCMLKPMQEDAFVAKPDGWQASLPMQIHMNRGGGRLDWYILAQPDAACFLVFREANTSLQAPCSGNISFGTSRWIKGEFTLLVRAPGGSWNASPLLMFPEKGSTLAWKSPEG